MFAMRLSLKKKKKLKKITWDENTEISVKWRNSDKLSNCFFLWSENNDIVKHVHEGDLNLYMSCTVYNIHKHKHTREHALTKFTTTNITCELN